MTQSQDSNASFLLQGYNNQTKLALKYPTHLPKIIPLEQGQILKSHQQAHLPCEGGTLNLQVNPSESTYHCRNSELIYEV